MNTVLGYRIQEALDELAEAEKNPATPDDLANYSKAQFIDGKFILDERSKAALDKAVHSSQSAKNAVWCASQVRAAYSKTEMNVPQQEMETLARIEISAYHLIADQLLYLAAMTVKAGREADDVGLNREFSDAKDAASNSGINIEERVNEILAAAHINSARRHLTNAWAVLYRREDMAALNLKIRALGGVKKYGTADEWNMLERANAMLDEPFNIGNERLDFARENLESARQHLEKAGVDPLKGNELPAKTYRHLHAQYVRGQTGNTLANGGITGL